MRRTLGAFLVSWCALGCAASPFRGGHAEPERPLRGVTVLQSFIVGHCEDARHAEQAPRFNAVELVETASGKLELFEHREGHERLVVENFHSDGSFWVFELVIHGNHVRRFRIPRSQSGTGSVEAGLELREHAHGDGFEAELASTRARCALVPKDSQRPPSAEKWPESARQ